jgi:hypothetical protein
MTNDSLEKVARFIGILWLNQRHSIADSAKIAYEAWVAACYDPTVCQHEWVASSIYKRCKKCGVMM